MQKKKKIYILYISLFDNIRVGNQEFQQKKNQFFLKKHLFSTNADKTFGRKCFPLVSCDNIYETKKKMPTASTINHTFYI